MTEKALFSIAVKENWDRVVALPFREHYPFAVSSIAPAVMVKVSDVLDAVRAFQAGNVEESNRILSSYY